MKYAERLSNEKTAFCAFGNEDIFFQYYSQRPMVRFRTFDDFLSFYNKEGSIVCFAMMGPPMSDQHKIIFSFIYDNKIPADAFKNIFVFHLKG
jgi:hypothetical protein